MKPFYIVSINLDTLYFKKLYIKYTRDIDSYRREQRAIKVYVRVLRGPVCLNVVRLLFFKIFQLINTPTTITVTYFSCSNTYKRYSVTINSVHTG
jgi:hypothetical protein